MKYLFIITSVLFSSLIACDNFSATLASTSEDSAKNVATAPLRDLSITSANSYSDLFLDSTSLENFISSEKLSDSLATELRNFYNVRNYQFAWFDSDGFTEEGRGFWSLYDYENGNTDSLKENKALAVRMDTLMEADTLLISSGDSSFVKTELSLTKEFFENASSFKNQLVFSGPYHFVPIKKIDVMQLADSILNKYPDSAKTADTTASTLGRPYNLLKEQLRRYYEIAQKGGWQPIPAGAKKFRKGNSSPIVAAIKKRLALTGEYQGTDTTQVYSDSLEAAIKSYKRRHGFDSTATLSDSLIRDMNIPVTQRIEQILINMNRMAWMPDMVTQQLIEVNIPEFMMNIYEGNAKAFTMKVVVGKEGANTTMFSGNLNQVVFSPYWNIPASIVEEEILPAMKNDPNYLQKNHMEVVTKNDSLPVIRQVPGPDNPLGGAKFLFPNSYDIFLHDTPKKELFDKKKRAYSHGCIRVEDATKLAAHLLKDDPSWTTEKIEQAMKSGKEQYVRVKKPVPVMITYFTAWVDENGQMNFREDIYKHDLKTRERLFSKVSGSQPGLPQDSLRSDTSKKIS